MSTTLKQDLEHMCGQILERKRWTQFRDFQVVVEPTMSAFGAHITLADWKIKVIVGEDFYQAVDSAIKDRQLDLTRDAMIEKIMYTLLLHEHGHFAYAPKTKEDLQHIIAGIYQAIEGREYQMDTIQQLCFYIHNMYTDTILNTVNAHTDDDQQLFRDGLALTYILMNNYTSKVLKQKTDKAHALFLSSNQILCQTDIKYYEKIQPFFPRFFASFNRYRGKIMDIFTGNHEITQNALKRELTDGDRTAMLRHMQDTASWEAMAYEYALIVYPFLRQQFQWMQSSYTRKQPSSGSESGTPTKSNSPSQPQSGSGQGKEGLGKKEKPLPQPGSGQKKTSGSDTKKTGSKEEKEEENHQSDAGKQIIRRLIADTIHVPYSSPFLKQFARLDRLYTQRAGRLALFAEEEASMSPHLEIPLGQEQVSPEAFRLKGMDWASTRFYERPDGSRNIELYHRNIPLILPFEVEEKQGGLPDLAWIFDSSISVEFRPFEGEGEGDYHFAAQTFYSQLNYLEEIGIAPLLHYFTANFSRETISSGWCSYSEINTAKRAIFDYQGLGTYLDPAVFCTLRQSRRDNALCFMLSDTRFNSMSNMEEILREIDEMQSMGGIGFYLFLLGGSPTYFSSEIERRGLPVHPIQRAEDFLHAQIRFTKDLYSEVVRS